MEGWVKLHRSLLDWEWWDDFNVTRLWIYILLRINHKENKWRGITISPGTFITSYQTMSNDTGLTVNELRTALAKLKRSKNVTSKTTNKYQVVTVVNWEQYQSDKEKTTSKTTSRSQSINRPLTTNKNEKNDKNNKPPISPLHPEDVFAGRSFPEPLKAKLIEWLAYKAERKEKYKPIGLKNLLTLIEKKTAEHGESAVINLITECMANQWQGIIWERIGKTQRGEAGVTDPSRRKL